MGQDKEVCEKLIVQNIPVWVHQPPSGHFGCSDGVMYWLFKNNLPNVELENILLYIIIFYRLKYIRECRVTVLYGIQTTFKRYQWHRHCPLKSMGLSAEGVLALLSMVKLAITPYWEERTHASRKIWTALKALLQWFINNLWVGLVKTVSIWKYTDTTTKQVLR